MPWLVSNYGMINNHLAFSVNIDAGICKLTKDPGPCYAAITRYFYNTVSKRCELFVYGGCEGNANNFPSKQKCERICLANNGE